MLSLKDFLNIHWNEIIKWKPHLNQTNVCYKSKSNLYGRLIDTLFIRVDRTSQLHVQFERHMVPTDYLQNIVIPICNHYMRYIPFDITKILIFDR